ncbi:CRAL-TRIO domain containing protein, partial [Oryctes borbonicus]
MAKNKVDKDNDLWNVIMPDEGVKAELDLGEPPQEYQEWALKELGELPDTRVQKLDELRDMIYERGECEPHRTDDAFLLRFLRARYFIVEKAYKLVVNYYSYKEQNPEFFDNVHLGHLVRLGKVIIVPPYREQTGRRILLYRIGNWDTSEISVTELFQATLIVLELAILEQRAQILGGIAMFDLGGLTLNQALHMTPSVASKMVQIMVTH